MNNCIVFIMGVLCLVILFLGNEHWKNMSEKAGIEGQITAEKNLKKEQEDRNDLINSLNPEKNKSQSMIDFLHYRALTQEKVIVSVIGSNGTAGTGISNPSNGWPEILKKAIQSENEDLESLVLINHGHEGYSTSDLLKEKKIDLVIKDHPDLVIFENAQITNHYQSIKISKTENDLENIMTKLQKKLPNAKILIMSPNPVANSKNKNSIGLNYLDYLKESEKVINKNNWTYIDSIEGINKKLKVENILLVDILAKDQTNLNEKGNVLWFSVLYEYLK